jgi:hypothetical protein
MAGTMPKVLDGTNNLPKITQANEKQESSDSKKSN